MEDSNNEPNYFEQLPNDMLQEICAFLPLKSVFRLKQTCKGLNQRISNLYSPLSIIKNGEKKLLQYNKLETAYKKYDNNVLSAFLNLLGDEPGKFFVKLVDGIVQAAWPAVALKWFNDLFLAVDLTPDVVFILLVILLVIYNFNDIYEYIATNENQKVKNLKPSIRP